MATRTRKSCCHVEGKVIAVLQKAVADVVKMQEGRARRRKREEKDAETASEEEEEEVADDDDEDERKPPAKKAKQSKAK